MCVFFFKQKTAYEMRISDWSSDVCSSDLSPEGIFTHVCGLKTVMPSNPYDAKGLLIAAIEDDDPVIFFEPKRLYNGPFDGHHDRPLQSWEGPPAAEELGRASRRERVCASVQVWEGAGNLKKKNKKT